jgi:hypothetical protein
MAAALTRRTGAPRFVLAVTSTAREADDLTAALGCPRRPDPSAPKRITALNTCVCL